MTTWCFYVQEKLLQHETMSALNESSLNTLRLYTYRDPEKNVHFMDECAIIRIGGRGSIKDNVSAGGGFCALGGNGEIPDRFLREKSFDVRSLADETGVRNAVVPNYTAAKKFVCMLHKMSHGPIFGRYLDEVMSRIKGCKTRYHLASVTTFVNNFRRIEGIVTY